MKIGIDLDGVLVNFVDSFKKVCKDFGVETDINSYGMGVSSEKFLEIYDYMIDVDVFARMTAYPHVKRTVKKWAKEHEIWYITRRRPAYRMIPAGSKKTTPELKRYLHQRQTKEWLFNFGFPTPQNIVFTQEKGVWCEENDVKILIEDYLPDALRWNSDKLKVWLINREWNQGDYPHRIKSLSKINL